VRPKIVSFRYGIFRRGVYNRNMNKNKMTVSAVDLAPGDVLLGSGETLLAIFRHGLSIPTGKCEVVLSKGDRTRRTLFGKATTITVERAS
jgi:hypothetical protein